MNFDTLQMARSKEWSTTADEDEDICEVVQKAADICNTCRCQEPLTKDPPPSPPPQPTDLLFLGGRSCCVWDDKAGQFYFWGNMDYHITPEVFPYNPIDIAFGPAHTCMIMQSGELKCWGSNFNGVLGLGHTHYVSIPTTVTGVHDNAMQVELGGYHSCIIANDKNVYCWGLNDSDYDILGIGSDEQYVTTPTTAVQLDGGIGIGAIQIAAGSYHTCVIDTNNNVQCWGMGYTSITVVALEGGVGAVQIAAYGSQTCVIDTTGNVQFWENQDPNPKILPLGEGVLATQLGVGSNHVCALVNDTLDPLQCWGSNEYGQLGDGTIIDFNNLSSGYFYIDYPDNVVLEGVEGVITELKTGDNHNCIIVVEDDAKKVFCWGKYGDVGNIDGTTNEYITRPELVLTMKKD
jgi:alpha-tubulin suppressor-like RCC1 family protein